MSNKSFYVLKHKENDDYFIDYDISYAGSIKFSTTDSLEFVENHKSTSFSNLIDIEIFVKEHEVNLFKYFKIVKITKEYVETIFPEILS